MGKGSADTSERGIYPHDGREVYRKYTLKHDLSYDDFKDMIQEGRIALLKAAQTYETRHVAGFLSYAKTFLFHAATDYIRKAERSEKAKTAAGDTPPEKIYSITESDFDPYRFHLSRSI